MLILGGAGSYIRNFTVSKKQEPFSTFPQSPSQCGKKGNKLLLSYE